MSIRHHPSDDLLIEYAAGSLDEGWSLAIASHLALCPACRTAVARGEAIGGSLVADAEPAAMAVDALERTLARLGDAPQEVHEPMPPVTRDPIMVLPQPLRGYLGGDVDALGWKRLGVGAFHIPIATGGRSKARLLRIPGGFAVPEHGHRGGELTLVLAGSFSDEGGQFRRGDLEYADDDLQHQPIADAGEDCICLAVTEAPLRFKGLVARLAQPLLGI